MSIKFNKRMTIEHKTKILELHAKGFSNVLIGQTIEFSNTTVRQFLLKSKLNSNIPKTDRSRPCKICGKVFTPKSYDGIKKDKYTNCSVKCGSLALKYAKTKYTEYDIKNVIECKKKGWTNKEISNHTKVNINKIKEIIRENKVFLSPEQAQKNAYQAKLKKNPKCMENMRDKYRIQVGSNAALLALKQSLRDMDYEYISGFIGKTKPFIVKCLICQKIRETSKLHTLSKETCKSCSNTGVSKQEKEIADWILSCGFKNKKLILPNTHGREIDVYIPSLKIGIEYCGLYWHNENSPTPRDRSYHYSKMQQANEQGIRLITIFEEEWLNRQHQVKNFLKSVLGIFDKRIFARKCQIKNVEKDIAKEFLEQNHIQGKAPFQIALGLYLQDRLYGLITGNRHHRQDHKEDFILNRLVFSDSCQVVGGASKLLKYLIKYAKEGGYKNLTSWSDNRWSQGNVYEKLGFELSGELLPDYSYTDGSLRMSKQSNTKKKLLEKGATGTTEQEMAQSLGYNRIWDCGKKRWTIKF